MWYVNGAWLLISSAQFVLEHLYLIFHPIFPVCRNCPLGWLCTRCCDILFKYAIVIWTTLTVRCRPFEHNKVHHPWCCKLRVKRGVGQIYIVQSKQALPINYNHGTLEEGKKRRINQGKTSGQRTYADCHSLWSVLWNSVQRLKELLVTVYVKQDQKLVNIYHVVNDRPVEKWVVVVFLVWTADWILNCRFCFFH